MKVIILITHHPTKVIMLKLEKKSSDRNNVANHTSQNEGDTNNRKRTLIIGDSIVENIEGWRFNKKNEIYSPFKIDPWRNNEGYETSC